MISGSTTDNRTLIDHLYTNLIKENIYAGTLETYFNKFLFWKGNPRIWQVATAQEKYSDGFSSLVDELNLADEVFTILEKYVCHLYGQPNLLSVNEARYRMLTLGKSSEESLPNSDSLYQHILRANYEAYIRKQSMLNNFAVPSPNGFGWVLQS